MRSARISITFEQGDAKEGLASGGMERVLVTGAEPEEWRRKVAATEAGSAAISMCGVVID
jgi:hypothetical protein